MALWSQRQHPFPLRTGKALACSARLYIPSGLMVISVTESEWDGSGPSVFTGELIGLISAL